MHMSSNSTLTLSAILPGFVLYMDSERRFSAGTVCKYRENILWITRHRGDPALDVVDLQWIVNLKSYLVASGAGASRIAGVIYALKNALVYARDVLGVPVMNLALVRAPGAPRRQVTYLTNDEYSAFVEMIPLYTRYSQEPRLAQLCFRALVETLAATAMRISEALSLNRDALDLSKGETVIVGKGNKQRTVFFTQRATTWIAQYLSLREDGEQAVFAGACGRRLQATSVNAMFRRISRQAMPQIGKRVTPHILRHTAATNLLQRGCPIGHIKEILGHQNLETTCRFYLGQLTKQEVRKAFDTYMTYDNNTSELPQPPDSPRYTLT